MHEQKKGKEILSKLIPDPENIDSKHIFGEIEKLSIIWLGSSFRGILGGVVGDKLTEKKWKDKNSKIKLKKDLISTLQIYSCVM